MLESIFRRLSGSETTTSSIDPYTSAPVLDRTKGKHKRGLLHLNTGLGTGVSTVPSVVPSSPVSLSTFSTSSRSPNRIGPPNVAWLNNDRVVEPQFPAQVAVRVHTHPHIVPMGRSVSSPPTSPSYTENTLDAVPAVFLPHSTLPLRSNSYYSRSTHSLRLDLRHNYEYDGYPPVKQLSPIAEQDYFSPEALRRSTPLPISSSSSSDNDNDASLRTPSGSQYSGHTITRPSPVFTHPAFISRPLNRTNSQNSSHTHVSTASCPPQVSTRSSSPPTIPPLDLRPPFPGPHPSRSPTSTGPPLRPPKPQIDTLSTIAGSAEDYIEGNVYDGGSEDQRSLHAESFVTAADNTPIRTANPFEPSTRDMAITEVDRKFTDTVDIPPTNPFEDGDNASIPSNSNPSGSRLNITYPDIVGRWERDASFGTGLVTFPKPKEPHRFSFTPACWIFWIGFLCPPIWMIGGWYFTILGEPPRLAWWTLWSKEYEAAGCLRRKKIRGTRKGQKELVLPRWVMEQSDATSQQNALRGISFGYPFVPSSVDAFRSFELDANSMVSGPKSSWIHKIPGIRATSVGPKEWGRFPSSRRIIDPWIERCRFALFMFLVLLCISTVVAFIVVNLHVH